MNQEPSRDEFKGDFKKAYEAYKTELEQNEETLGSSSSSNLCPVLNHLAATCLKLNDLSQARIYAERLQLITKEWQLRKFAKCATKLLDEIALVRIKLIKIKQKTYLSNKYKYLV
jgi:hypothetical protein